MTEDIVTIIIEAYDIVEITDAATARNCNVACYTPSGDNGSVIDVTIIGHEANIRDLCRMIDVEFDEVVDD